MAEYSLQLREIIEQPTQDNYNLSHRERIEIGRKKLFDFDYPLFDENYRKQFETNIIRKFYMREIGFEVEELFKFQLETWLNINMPYFNNLFESELIKYNPLENSRMEVTHTKTNDKEQNDLRNIDQSSNTHGTGNTESEQIGNVDTTQNSTTDSEKERDYLSDTDETHTTESSQEENQFNRKLDSDTPQNRLQITTGEGTGIIEYASSIKEDKSNSNIDGNESGNKNTDVTDNEKTTTTSNTDSTGNVKDKTDFTSQDETNVDSSAEQEDRFKSEATELEDFIQNRVGKIGVQSYSKLIQDYREALLRIEVQIHNEMQELFMLVY